jgi:hypothetical protein
MTPELDGLESHDEFENSGRDVILVCAMVLFGLPLLQGVEQENGVKWGLTEGLNRRSAIVNLAALLRSLPHHRK